MSDNATGRGDRQATWNFGGDVVLITGAARGQGKSHALAFAESGARLVLADTDATLKTVYYPLSTPADLAATAEECRALGAEVVTATCDVRDSAQVDAMVAAAIKAFGKIDVLVTNAGIASLAHITDLSEDAWDEVLDTNLKGTFLCAKAVAPHMIAAGSGKMVLIGSINSFAGVPSAAHYVSSKHGVAGLAKVLAIDLAPHGITVNYVCPTAVNTTMVEAMSDPAVPADFGEKLVAATGSWNMLQEDAPPIEPEEITEAVLWLASDSARFTTGSPLVVDAGFLAK